MMIKGKNTGIVAVNASVVALAVLSLVLISSVQPLYPFSGALTEDRTPTFEWTGRHGEYTFMIDEDESFSSPMTFTVNGRSYTLRENLDFGTYWWKVSGMETETKSMKISIVSTVALSRPFGGTVVNSGNTPLLLHISGITGALTLPVNESIETGDKHVKAEQAY